MPTSPTALCFLADGLTDGMEYKCLEVKGEFLRIIDDSGEDYLYPAGNPASLSDKVGRWTIIKDSDDGILQKTLRKYLIAV